MDSSSLAAQAGTLASAVPIHGHGEPSIIFDAVPIDDAESFLLLIVIYSICLGMVILEFFAHLGFDYQLIRKPGWKDRAKFISRTAYLLCRTVPAVFLSLVLTYLTTPFDNCETLPLVFNIMAMIALDAVLLVFLQRTMALYSWKRKVVLPLTIMYVVTLGLSAVSMPLIGVGRRIPGSHYCAYDTRRDVLRYLIPNIVYKSSSMILDLTLLLLTMHRLVDGGLKTVFSSRAARGLNNVSQSSLSSFLLRQGLHFYGLQTATEIVFIAIFFSTTQVSYQVLGSALLLSIPPISAGAAFREMGKKASTVTQRHQVNEIMNSSTNNTSQNKDGAIGGGQTMSRSERRRGSTILEDQTTTSANFGTRSAGGGFGLGINSPNGHGGGAGGLHRDNSAVGTSTLSEKNGNRVTWGTEGQSDWNPQSNGHDDGAGRFQSSTNGILVTIGTMSRSDEAGTADEEQWAEHGSNRYSSDLADPDAMEMRRQPSKDSRSTTTSHSAARSRYPPSSAAPSRHLELQQQALYGGARQSPSSLEKDGHHVASSSPWVPQTPESPYPLSMSQHHPSSAAAAPPPVLPQVQQQPTTAWNNFMHGDTAFEPVTVPVTSLSPPPGRYRSPVLRKDSSEDAPWRTM